MRSLCFVQNVGRFSITEAREKNAEDEEYLPDDGHTRDVSNHDASHDLSDSDDPDYIPSETNTEDEEYLPDDGHTRDISNHDASHDLSDSDDPDYIPSETNTEDEEYLPDDGHTRDVSTHDDPEVAQKRCVKTASVQGHKSKSDVARLSACQTSEQENCDSYLPDDDASEDTTTEKICEPAITFTRTDKMVTYFDKRPYCLFCSKPQTQIQRHWLSKHYQEREVIELMSLRDQTERIRHVTRLRNLGNHSHNKKVLEEGNGEILVTYRPKRDTKASDYVPCEACWAYVLKGDLFRHRCKFPKKETRVRGRCAAEAELLLPPPKGTSAKVRKLLNGMMVGTVKLIAKTDPLIVQYAAKLIDRKGMEKKAHIRDKVRELARFLLEIRKQPGHKNITLEECIDPKHFRDCVMAVKSLAGFDEENSVYDKPSLAVKLGHTLSQLTKVLKANALELRDDEKLKNIDYFHEQCVLQWADEVGYRARQVIQDRKRNKIKMLPLTGDVQKLNTYLSDMSIKYSEALRNAEETTLEHCWRNLAETTLAQLITFNRRRQGEVSRMTLDDYGRKTVANLSDDAATALSPLELSLAKLFARVEIVGKRNRPVPVMLTAKHQACIDLLIERRSECGIRPDNRYLFAYSHSENHLRGHAALKTASAACGAQHPATLTSTNFRKHVATLSQVLNLKDNELDMLAQYMGHDVRIHRQYYRLPNDLLQTTKLAKIFMLMDSGNLPSQKGKSLDEIVVNVVDNNDGKSSNKIPVGLAVVLYCYKENLSLH